MTTQEIEAWLLRHLESALGIPLSTVPTDLPAGVGTYGWLELAGIRTGRAIGTRTYTYRLNLGVGEQTEEAQAQRILRTLLDRITAAFSPGDVLRDANPFESLVADLDAAGTRSVSITIEVEVV